MTDTKLDWTNWSHNDYKIALSRIYALWDSSVDTPEFAELSNLVDLVESYETKHFPIASPTPEEAADFREEQELSRDTEK
jgi:HTH-type transcriptional regulator/antitoxin HigA